MLIELLLSMDLLVQSKIGLNQCVARALSARSGCSRRQEECIPPVPQRIYAYSCLSLFLQGYSAYDIAVRAGFEGTEEEWLESLHGESAYKIAVKNGYTGTEEEWLQSLHGAVGESAYQTAVNNGFVGTEEDWLKSLKGKSSYELAVANGFLGTEQEWLNDIGDNTELRQRISRIESVLEWIPNM